MAKYKVGDEIVLKVRVADTNASTGKYPVRIEFGGDYSYMTAESIERAIVDMPTPAPLAPAGWTPKVGERVLVELYFERVDQDGDIWTSTLNSGGTRVFSPDTPIYPAPVKPARFKVGDEVFSKSQMEQLVVVRSTGVEWYAKDGDGNIDIFQDADLLTLAEARERLAK